MLRLIGLTVFLPMLCMAARFQTKGSPYTTISDVPIYKQATLSWDTGTVPLYLTGAGIRQKNFGFINVDVYVGVSYTDLVTGISPANPMDSVAQSHARVMVLNIVRDLTADQVKNGFIDSLTANSIDLNDPAIKSLIDDITFDIPANSVAIVESIVEPGGMEKVAIEFQTKDVQSSRVKLGYDFWKNWFGIPEDKGKAALQKELVGVIP